MHIFVALFSLLLFLLVVFVLLKKHKLVAFSLLPKELKERLSLLEEGLESYYRWQSYPFYSYILISVVLLYLLLKVNDVENALLACLVFFAGILVFTAISYFSSFSSLLIQKIFISEYESERLFVDLYKRISFSSLISVASTLFIALLVYQLFGLWNLVYFVFGGCFVSIFTQITGSLFYKSSDVSEGLVISDFSGIKVEDRRNSSFWGKQIGILAASVGGYTATIISSCLILFLGAVFFVQTSYPALVDYIVLVFLCGLFACAAGLFLVVYKSNKSSKYMRNIIHGTYLSLFFVALFSYFLGLVMVDSVLFQCVISIVFGLIAALIVSFVFEFFASTVYRPVRSVAEKAQYGSVNTMLAAFSKSLKSMIVSVLVVCVMLFVSYKAGGLIFIPFTGLGMVALVAIIISMSLFSAVTELSESFMNANSLEINSSVKNLSSISATLKSISQGYGLLISFVSSLTIVFLLAQFFSDGLTIGYGFAVAFVVAGVFVPYILMLPLIKGLDDVSIFAADRAKLQLQNTPYLIEDKTMPDIKGFVKRVVRKSQQYSFLPVAVAILIPLIFGLLYGKQVLFMFLLGAVVSGILLAMIFSNIGSLLGNVKKYIELGNFGGPGTPTYKTSVDASLGGSPLRDAISPSLDVLIKIMVIFSLIIFPLLK